MVTEYRLPSSLMTEKAYVLALLFPAYAAALLSSPSYATGCLETVTAYD